MDAMILCGGLGTRLRGTWDGPKCLAPVNGRPFLLHLLDQLHRARVARVVLCTGYKGHEVSATVSVSRPSLEVLTSWEREPLGTAGALRRGSRHVRGQRVLVLNGDSYLNFDLRTLHEWHSNAVTVACTRMDDVEEKCGAVWETRDVNPNPRRLTRLERGLNHCSWASAGVCRFDRAVLKALPRVGSLEDAVLPALIEQGKVDGMKVNAPFIDIGTPKTLEAAESFFHNISPTALAAARER